MVVFRDDNGDCVITTEEDPENREVIERYMYYAFGMQWDGVWRPENTPPYDAPNRYRYNGKPACRIGREWHFSSRMLDYGFRYYMPEIGRFSGVDPLADHPNQVDKSPYAYTWNNPILLNDPDGRCPECEENIRNPTDGQKYISSGGMEYIFENGDWTGQGGTLSAITITSSRTDTDGSRVRNHIGTSAQAGLMMGEITRQAKAYQFFGSTAQASDEALAAGKYIHNGEVYWQGNYRGVTNSMDNSLSTAKFVKATGKSLGALNITVTGYQVVGDISDGKYYSAGTRAAVAGIAAGATFIPVVGWGVAIGIGVADAIWGERFYNYVESQLGK